MPVCWCGRVFPPGSPRAGPRVEPGSPVQDLPGAGQSTSVGRLSRSGSGGESCCSADVLIATKLNTLPKYVVSRTLTDEQADWSPTTVLRGGLVEDVRRLTGLPGKELQVHGSWQLVQALHQAGLVDLYRLLQDPVVVGTGKRLFPDGSPPATFAGTEGGARVLPGGVVALTLTPAALGVLSAGAYTVDGGRSTTVVD